MSELLTALIKAAREEERSWREAERTTEDGMREQDVAILVCDTIETILSRALDDLKSEA